MNLRRSGAWVAFLGIPLLLAAQQAGSFSYVLKNRDVRSVLARVTEELGPRGQILVDGAGNRLTVRDDEGRLDQIHRLVLDLDVPARHFAVAARLELLPKTAPKGLFRAAPGFVDMTQWAESVAPTAVYDGVVDLYEGKNGECLLGKEYRLYARAGGYDPSHRRLALPDLSLTHVSGSKQEPLLQGAAVLPEGEPTLFLVGASADTPSLRLRATPTLLPSVARPEVR